MFLKLKRPAESVTACGAVEPAPLAGVDTVIAAPAIGALSSARRTTPSMEPFPAGRGACAGLGCVAPPAVATFAPNPPPPRCNAIDDHVVSSSSSTITGTRTILGFIVAEYNKAAEPPIAIADPQAHGFLPHGIAECAYGIRIELRADAAADLANRLIRCASVAIGTICR
jgi:hypothetical protein